MVGSQAILGSFPDASTLLRTSQDLDLFVKSGATLEVNELIDAEYGQTSKFALEKGFYIEPVGEWTMLSALPGWPDRLVKVETTAGAIGWCISPLDIAYNKAEAGREKDIEYLAELFRTHLIRPSEIKVAMDAAKLPPEQAEKVHLRIQEAIRRSLR